MTRDSTANDRPAVMGGPQYEHGGGGGPVSSLLVMLPSPSPASVDNLLSQAWYDYLMVDLRDPRVDSWPLMSSIWPTTAICCVYVYTVKVLGPRYDAIGD